MLKNTSKKMPPYGREALRTPETGPDRAIIICTGSEGFKRAAESKIYSWVGSIKHKLALPFGHDPNSYLWPVNDHIVSIHQFGTFETPQTIECLAICCLHHGAVQVLVVGPGEFLRYFPSIDNKEVAA